MNLLLSILGFTGGICCFAGDLLAGILGKGNKKLGTKKNINSNWVNIAAWRINLSQILGTLGSFLIACGFYSFALQMQSKSNILYIIYLLCAGFCMLGGPIIHYIAIVPVSVCRELLKKNDIASAERIIDQINSANIILLILFMIVVLLGGSIATVAAIVKGYFQVPVWFVVFNQLFFMILRSILMKIAGEKVGLLPGIASLGLALMLGVIGVSNVLSLFGA